MFPVRGKWTRATLTLRANDVVRAPGSRPFLVLEASEIQGDTDPPLLCLDSQQNLQLQGTDRVKHYWIKIVSGTSSICFRFVRNQKGGTMLIFPTNIIRKSRIISVIHSIFPGHHLETYNDAEGTLRSSAGHCPLSWKQYINGVTWKCVLFNSSREHCISLLRKLLWMFVVSLLARFLMLNPIHPFTENL